jgi:hypothetical protein
VRGRGGHRVDAVRRLLDDLAATSITSARHGGVIEEMVRG